MSTERRPFKYSPLKSARLLSNKGKGKAGAPCDYDALSYTWGKPDEGFPIICNGRTLVVRRNLHDALRCLARRLQQAGSSPRRIWIDAVCINQSDEDEKSEHISRMGNVYRFARQVVVWLGPGHGADHNDAAIALLPLLTQVGEATFEYMMDSRQPEPDFSNMTMPAASSPVWKVLSDIMFHDWYTRLWIVQELALAQSVVALVGDSMLDFDTLENFLSASTWFAEISNILSPTSSVVTPIPSPAPQSLTPETLDPLLNAVYKTTMPQQCTEAQDRVFGVLGFAEDRTETRALGLEDKWDPAELAKLYTIFMGYVFERGGHVIQDPGRRFLWELFSLACLPKKTGCVGRSLF
ncbi:hypothetical protein INS49_011608 [Diaporthe citri]|uniref:uncharacterized protein n=1 Tax=Diaporthe citri TaxID=83186 RepID=UPI001C815BB9|nr:uncharacterized protein INS49_011608 [Diaporthe citri]KAG6360546.1 hypothetical protein INS49_011608 [Diaporthe citri]